MEKIFILLVSHVIKTKKAWENRVRAGLKGIQLHFVNGDTFMNDYMIKGIPRFILLDKEGKLYRWI